MYDVCDAIITIASPQQLYTYLDIGPEARQELSASNRSTDPSFRRGARRCPSQSLSSGSDDLNAYTHPRDKVGTLLNDILHVSSKSFLSRKELDSARTRAEDLAEGRCTVVSTARCHQLLGTYVTSRLIRSVTATISYIGSSQFLATPTSESKPNLLNVCDHISTFQRSLWPFPNKVTFDRIMSSSNLSQTRLLQGAGIACSGFLTGYISLFSVLDRFALMKAPTTETAKLWQGMYNVGKSSAPPMAIVSAGIFGYLASQGEYLDWKYRASADFSSSISAYQRSRSALLRNRCTPSAHCAIHPHPYEVHQQRFAPSG